MANPHKQLNRKLCIPHIKKCFAYAVAQNKGDSENLAKHLKEIPNHLYECHKNCGNWCQPKKKHTIQLSDQALYSELKIFFDKNARNARKFSVAASSQRNESFNNIVAHKAHKNKCLSKSTACDFRIADAVCVFNKGQRSVMHFRERIRLPEGTHTS